MKNTTDIVDEALKLLMTETAGRALDTSGNWIAWPGNLQSTYNLNKSNVGRGEENIAKLTHGRIMGGSITYDILGQDGSTWEVKEPISGEIKTGTEGRTAIVLMMKRITIAVNMIVNAFATAGSKLDMESVFSPSDLAQINKFISDDVEKIRKGEISPKRMNNLLGVLVIINKLLSMADDGSISKPKWVEIGDETNKLKKKIDINTYVNVCKMLGLTKDEMKITHKEFFTSMFNNPAFYNPNEWFTKTWTNGIKPSDVFGKTTGLILVTPRAYRVLMKDHLDTHLKFKRISQGVPRFATFEIR
jgi:hypothetical protein